MLQGKEEVTQDGHNTAAAYIYIERAEIINQW